MKSPYFIGTKFYHFTDKMEKPVYYRMVKYKDRGSDGVMYLKEQDSGMYLHILVSELKDSQLTVLKKDGVMTFSICKVGPGKDTIVCLHKDKDNHPYAVCRQSISDIFANTVQNDPLHHYVGISVNRDTCPSNVKFNTVLTCDSIESTTAIAVYIDDTLEDIIGLINTNKFDSVLRQMKLKFEGHTELDVNPSSVSRTPALTGYMDSLYDLLKYNQFMKDFHQCFDIIECPFKLDEETTELNENYTKFLMDKLAVEITKTYVHPYTKELDLKKFVRDYVIIQSIFDNKLYVIGYDKLED